MGKCVTTITLDRELWMKAKIYAVKRGKTLSQLISSLLEKTILEDEESLA